MLLQSDVVLLTTTEPPARTRPRQGKAFPDATTNDDPKSVEEEEEERGRNGLNKYNGWLADWLTTSERAREQAQGLL